MTKIKRAVFVATVVLVSLAGCSRDGSATSNVSNGNSDNGDVNASAAKDENVQLLDEARTFIKTHYVLTTTSSDNKLDDGTPIYQFFTESPSNISLGDEWSWEVHSTHTSRPDFRAEQVFRYSMKPGELSLPVEVVNKGNFHEVKLECAVGKCISSEGWRDVHMEGMRNKGREQDRNPINVIALGFDSADEAARVDKAFTVLLKAAGAKDRRF